MSLRTTGKNDGGSLCNIAFTALLVVTAISLFCALAFPCRDILMKIESRSLFLNIGTFFLEKMELAGGFMVYISCFITQFLKFPVLGAAITTVLWCSIVLLTRRAFRLDGALAVLAFLPASLIIASDMVSGYMIFEYRNQGWFFNPLIGYAVTLISIISFRRTSCSSSRMTFTILWTALGYPLFGFYALLGSLCMAVISIAEGKSGCKVALSAAISAVASPLLWSSFVYHTIKVGYSFFATLPRLFDVELFMRLWMPYFILVTVTLVLAYLSYSIIDRLSLSASASVSRRTIIFSVSAAVSLLIAYGFWYKDPNFYADLQMDTAVENINWERTAKIHREFDARFKKYNNKIWRKRTERLETVSDSYERDKIVDEFKYRFRQPTRAMVIYKNLALVRLGKSGSQMFTYSDGDRIPWSPFVLPLSIQCGKQLYYHYGMVNFCYRWCIEDAVEYGWSNEVLKYAVRSTLIAQDWDIAEKYISQLEHTTFYRKWAAAQRRYLRHPELFSESDEYSGVIPLLNKTRQNTNDKAFPEDFLISQFSAYNWHDATPEGSEAAMQWALQSQDIRTFWDQLSIWILTHKGEPLPRHYQEAAYLYSHLENNVDVSTIQFSPDIAKSYEDFMNFASKHPIHNLDESRYIYHEKFGNTFYYYYYFIRDLKSH